MDHTLDFGAALDLILEQARSSAAPATESLPLLNAHRRTLARPLLADRDQPPFDRSTRDGFALLAGPYFERSVVGLVRAGETWTGPDLTAGEAVEIMTGAPVPAGADAVLMVEHATHIPAVSASPDQRSHLTFSADRTPVPGQNIVPRGAEIHAGDTALPTGIVLAASEIAIAAALGAHHVPVFRRPRVAILATGDELVELEEQGQAPEPHQIRNSNSFSLAALVLEAGGEPVRLPIVRDRTEDLTRALAQARTCDLILFSGGVSMGKFDLVEQALTDAGARFFFTGVRLQPGKPVVFGSLPTTSAQPETPFFGLPGNPISTQVTFLCFVAPLLRGLAGQLDLGPLFAQAALAEAVPARPGLTRLLPARLVPTPAAPAVSLIPWQGSGDLAANARANAYVLLPADHTDDFLAGETVSLLLR